MNHTHEQGGAGAPQGANENALSATLKTRHLTMMSIAGVIGGSLFVGSGSIVHSAGPAAVLAYLAGGIVVVFIMRMLGEMATANPDTGSFSTYADRAIGRWAGFTIGWLYWGYWALLMAWEAHVAGIILHEWFPMLSVNAFTLGATLVLILLNFFNVRNYGEAEFWFALIKVVAIVCFIVVGTLAVLRLWPWGEAQGVANLVAHGGFMPNGGKAVVVALLGVMFAFLGVEIVTIAASESPNPAQQISRATRSVVWRVCLFYIGSIFLIAALVPWNDPLLGQSGYGAYRRTLELLGVPGAQFLMNFVVLTSVSSCASVGALHGLAHAVLAGPARRRAGHVAAHARAQRHTGAFGHRLLRRGGVHGPDQFRRFPASQGCAGHADEHHRHGRHAGLSGDCLLATAHARQAARRRQGAAGAHVAVSLADLGGDHLHRGGADHDGVRR